MPKGKPKMPDNNPDKNPSSPSSGGGAAAGSGNGSAPVSRPAVEPTVAARRERYMLASRAVPGLQPMSTDTISSALTSMSGVAIVKRIRPRGFGALTTDGGGTGGMPEIIVAEMDPAQAVQVRQSAPPHLIIERDGLLRPADGVNLLFNDPSTMLPGVGVDIRLRVVATSGRPLAKAAVSVFGLGFPAQGVTDETGEARVTFFGGSIDTVQAIYVKPAADYWDRMILRPLLSDGVNTLQLRALSDSLPGFPQTAQPGWGQQMMRLDQLDPSLAGQGVKIGIIDSGCDNTHPQLRHVTRGMDFTNNRDGASWSTDTVFHGTHCAGIITAMSNQMKGVRGFAPMAEVHAFKVFPGGRFSDMVDALDQCIERQIDIVNMSLGGDDVSELVARKLAEVRQNGIACIVAAGNDSGPVQFPASEPSVFAVAAIGKLDAFPPDSNHAQTVVPGLVAGAMFSPKFTAFGPKVAAAGPGVAIVSTVPGGGYAAWDGTSMATPHVTGFGALLLAHHPAFRDAFRVRNEQRVAQLFSLIAAACTRQLGDPTREGAGLPDLPRALGQTTSARPADGVQVASAPVMPQVLPGGGGFTPWGGGAPFDPRALQGIQPGQFASSPFAQNPALNAAVLQGLLQLRSAGLL
jgi:subtilisin family serine protease